MISNQHKDRFKLWFFEGTKASHPHEVKAHQDVWYKVMCLTGVDYFSTLGYQPGIAFLAAGLLSPLATLILVILTLFGALPIYLKVAKESPHGQGSFALLEQLLPKWKGKTFVLCLLGFAATDFIITITLSAADAAAHVVQNPLAPYWLQDRMMITLVLLAVLGAIFMKGFREAIGISFFLVVSYLLMNTVVIATALTHMVEHPIVLIDWQKALFAQHGSIYVQIGLALFLFPKLALGLSGFETGVAVMPHVRGDQDDSLRQPIGRIRNTHRLLITAAAIMSVLLLCSSLVTTTLIPASEFQEGGGANGRALAYLAHQYLGHGFGTVYDVITIAILWFAGASALAGLLNLVPRYLPHYGMAPEWARGMRPLVLFFTVVAFLVTAIFNANVDAQGAAYATGVLVLMTSDAITVTLLSFKEAKRKGIYFLIVTFVFLYTTIANCIERPDGLKIASIFIAAILITSLISRALRTMELRVREVMLDDQARQFVNRCDGGVLRLVAHRPGGSTNYDEKAKEACETHNIEESDIIFLEVKLGDASEFSDEVLEVRGVMRGTHKVLQCESPAVPNAIAALLLYARDTLHLMPHLYLGWTEGNPLVYVLKYLFFGEGETAPVVREILRETEKDPERRPRVHVG